MPNLRVEFILTKIAAERKVKNNREKRLNLLILQADALKVMDKDIPEALIDGISNLYDLIFKLEPTGSDERSLKVPVPPPPANIHADEKRQKPTGPPNRAIDDFS